MVVYCLKKLHFNFPVDLGNEMPFQAVTFYTLYFYRTVIYNTQVYQIQEIAHGRCTITLCNILSPFERRLRTTESSNQVEENPIVKAKQNNNNKEKKKQ